jgi:CheY-like chemotaxis protein
LGFDTAKALRGYPTTSDVPIIFITGYPYMQQHQQPGMKVLLKPFSMTVLVNAVKEATGLSDAPVVKVI